MFLVCTFFDFTKASGLHTNTVAGCVVPFLDKTPLRLRPRTHTRSLRKLTHIFDRVLFPILIRGLRTNLLFFPPWSHQCAITAVIPSPFRISPSVFSLSSLVITLTMVLFQPTPARYADSLYRVATRIRLTPEIFWTGTSELGKLCTLLLLT